VFDVLVCVGETAHRKPHPEPLQAALAQLHVPGDASAYVGDSPEDIEMARAAGAFTVGIPGGFPNREALHRSAPDLVVADLADAAARLLSLNAAGRTSASRSVSRCARHAPHPRR